MANASPYIGYWDGVQEGSQWKSFGKLLTMRQCPMEPSYAENAQRGTDYGMVRLIAISGVRGFPLYRIYRPSNAVYMLDSKASMTGTADLETYVLPLTAQYHLKTLNCQFVDGHVNTYSWYEFRNSIWGNW